MTKVKQIVKKQISKLELLPNEKIAVAVSGGSDSMGLVFALEELSRELQFRIYAITINHDLRSNSLTEALSVNKILLQHQINHEILTWIHNEKIDGNLQAAARNARYKLLTSYCNKNNIKYLCVGHNQGDVAENFMIRLERGSGLDGLAAIPYLSNKNNITIVRPFTDLNKQEIQQYLISKDISWFEDPSNDNIKFDRIRIRKEFEKKNVLQKRVFTAACHLRSVKDYLDIKIADKIAEIISIDPFGFITMVLPDFKKLHEYEQQTILTYCLQVIGDNDYKARYISLRKIIDNILNDNGKNFTLLGCNIRIYNDLIYIYPECNLKKEIKIVEKNFNWGNKFNFSISNVNQDISLKMLGKHRWQYLDKKNIIIPRHIPKFIIYSLPCFIFLEKVLAIPHIRYYSEKQFFDIKILPILTLNDI